MVISVSYCLLLFTPSTHANPIPSKSVIPDLNLTVPLPGLKAIDQEQFNKGEGLGIYIVGVYKFAIGFAAIAAMLVLVYGGILWLTARGDSGQVGESKKVMTNAIVGLVLALGSYTFLWIFNPRLVQFEPLKGLDTIKELTIQFEKYIEEPARNPDKPLPDAGTAMGNINQLMDTYKKIAAEEDVPWQVLAALHYKEGGANPNKSMLNGFEFCNKQDYSGKNCKACKEGSGREADFRCAAQWLKAGARAKYGSTVLGKAYPTNQRFNITQSSNDWDDPNGAILNGLYRYNGVAYGAIENSPYVNNNYDTAHTGLGIHATVSADNKTPVRGKAKQDGIRLFLRRMYNQSNYGSDGKLTSLN
ncbi:hypothetical protein HY620_03615 [Candidatus Uhrbacteria bacterium]|nr:hypothetical protein [Candidatus Uhrbacteria bacterium]